MERFDLLSALFSTALESADYQLTRCIASTKSSSIATSLVVKRFVKQFASNVARHINLEEVTIDDITLKEFIITNSPVIIYGPSAERYSGSELLSCRTFVMNGLTIYCHDAAELPCQFYSTYSCYQFAQFHGKSGKKTGQLLTVLISKQPRATCFFREFAVKKSFRERLLERTDAEASGILTRSCSVDEMCYELEVEPVGIVECDLSSLIRPVVVFKAKGLLPVIVSKPF